MFAQQIFQDFKENLKSNAPAKTSGSTRKGLASRSLNSFPDSSNVVKSKKSNTLDENKCQFLLEKSDVKPKMNAQEKKADFHSVNETWPEIEKMHIYDEPDDDYEDLLPQCERIQQEDIDASFLNYTCTRYAELTADKLPSPLKEVEGFDFPEFYSPPLPSLSPLLDDSEMTYIPLSHSLYLI